MDWFHPTGATGSPSPPPRRPEGGCIKKKGKERKVAWLQTTTTTTTSVPTLFLARKLLRRLPTSTTLQDGLSVASDSNSRAAPTQPPTHVQRGREKLKKEKADDDQIKRNGTNTHTDRQTKKRLALLFLTAISYCFRPFSGQKERWRRDKRGGTSSRRKRKEAKKLPISRAIIRRRPSVSLSSFHTHRYK